MVQKYIFNLIACLACVLLFCSANAQDLQFSQYISAPLHLNPALAGISYGPRVSMIYRNEWPKIDKGFVSYGAAYDMHISKINSGIGLSIYNDRIANGLLNTYNINASYNYQVSFNRKFGIRIGLSAGYTHKSVNWSRLTFNDQIDPIYGFVDQQNIPNLSNESLPEQMNAGHPDFAIGFVAFSKAIYGGFTVKHFHRPKMSFYGEDETRPTAINAFIGADIDLAPRKRNFDVYVSPNSAIFLQGSASQLMLGSYLTVQKVFGGAFFRYVFNNYDAIIGVIGVKFEYFKVAYSYDFTVSDLALASGGAHEASLIINFYGADNPLNPSRRKTPLDCPKFLNF
ncbi:MAG: PorP/SprF family type IX secretion system membrane protein [Chitinophagales bacterium]